MNAHCHVCVCKIEFQQCCKKYIFAHVLCYKSDNDECQLSAMN